MLSLLTVLHVLAAVVWIGGMVFAYTVLRPTIDEFGPPVKLPVLAGIFRRFFAWVWCAVVVLPVTGYLLIGMLYDEFFGAGTAVNLMQGIGWIMIALFVVLYFGPYPPFREAVAAEDWPRAAIHLPRIRRIILINLVLGIAITVIGAGGRYWG